MEQAIDWLLRLERGHLDGADRAAFEAWLVSAENAKAFGSVQSTWDAVDVVADDPTITAERARIMRGTRAPRHWRWVAAASVAALACAGLLLALVPGPTSTTAPTPAQADAGELIGTRLGERSSITLADGTVVTLNTDSAVRVAYSAAERRVVLERGQAFFAVAKQQPQPFVVIAGGQRVVATGTAFDVRLDPLRTKVVLVEGEVQVTPDGGRAALRVVLRPGQQLVAHSGRAAVITAADLDQLTSWTAGRLIFRDTPLREAVREVNRYTGHKIVLADQEMGSLRVSGVFIVGQPTEFARALAEVHPLSLREDGPAHTLVIGRHREQSPLP